jgi:hypothetical protein
MDLCFPSPRDLSQADSTEPMCARWLAIAQVTNSYPRGEFRPPISRFDRTTERRVFDRSESREGPT